MALSVLQLDQCSSDVHEADRVLLLSAVGRKAVARR